MSSFTLNHPSVSVVNFKQGTTTTAVKQVIFKAKDARGCALWCAPYTFYLPQSNTGYIKSVKLYRTSTEEPLVYTGTTSEVSSSGTTSYTAGGTSYSNTPYYQTYYKDKVYVAATAKDATYSSWYNDNDNVTTSTPGVTAATLTTTGDATSPNLTITNPNNFTVTYNLYYNNDTSASIASGTLSANSATTKYNLENGVNYTCILSKTWHQDKTTYSVSIGKDPSGGTTGQSSSSPWTISGSSYFLITGSASTTKKNSTQTKTANATKQPAARNTYAVTWDASTYCTAYTSTSGTATSGGGSGTQYGWGSEIIYAATLNNNDNDYYYTPNSSWGLISGRSYRISNHLITSAIKLNKATAVANKYNYSVGSSLSNATVNWYSNSGYSTALGKVQTGSTIYLKVNPNAHYQTTVSSTRYYNGNPYKTSVTFNSTNFTLSPDKSTPDSSSSATYKSFPTISAISYQPSSTNSNCSVSWTKATYGNNSTGTITPSSYYYSSSASITKAVNDTNFTISDANATAAYKTTVSCSPITYTISPTSATGGTVTWSSSTLKKGTTESSKLTLTPSAGFKLRSGITSGNTISWNSFSFSPLTSTNNTSTGTATYSLNAFEAIPYTLTISTLPTGCKSVTVQRSSVGTAGTDAGASTGTLSNNSTIYYGDKLSVSATPSATYYQLSYSSSITVDGNETVSISASYKSYPLTITVPDHCNSVQYRYKKQGGSWTSYTALTSTTTVNIEYGAEVQIGANPADGYTSNYPYSNPYSFTMPASSQSFAPVMSITAYTLNVKITGQITGAYVEIQRGDLGAEAGASTVAQPITTTTSYPIYKGDTIFISNITTNTGYHVVEGSYSTEYTVSGNNITVEPLSALNTYTFTITKGTGISRVYYKANGASSYSSSTNTTTNVTVNHGSTIYVYGTATTNSLYLPCNYSSSSPYTQTITGAGSVTMSANSMAAPVLTREGNAYQTQFKVTNNNPYAMTFYYGTSSGATTYSTTISANSSTYINSSVSEGNTVYGKFYYSGTSATSGNTSLALTAINYSTSSTATTTGSQVTIKVASSSGTVSGIEVGYGASSTWSTTITSNATSSGWSKSFNSPSTSATYFHYRKKGYTTKYNVFNYTMSKLTAPTLDFYQGSGNLRVYNRSGITADVYHSLNSTYGSGTIIKSSLANNGYYDHTTPTPGNANFYYLKPNSNSCRFNSDKASYNVPGTSVETSASLYYYNAGKDDESLIGTMSSTIPTTVKDIGVYPHFDLYELLFRIKYSPTAASVSVSVSGGGMVIELDSGNGFYDFWIESPGEEVIITITIGSENRYIKISGTKDGWPD